ncbi:MAG TPA: amino acid adenylation domain-containing protein, partial [Thermoanaerobaculia bacterium]|nr:amino acid adenylation domain-containing protein [Thermoanaerobaculia bacterium]
SVFMALLAAFDVLLCRFTGQEDVVVGSPIANRTRPELERLIGFFVNTLVLRTDASDDPPFTGLVDRVKEVSLGAFAHQDLPFEQLVEELQPRRDLSRNPLFQVMLNLLNAPPPRLEVMGGLEMSALPAGEGAALFDLQAYVTETPEGLRLAWEHNTDLFDRATIERLSHSFETLLSGIVAHPEARLWDLPLLSEGERSQLLLRWNGTAAPMPEPGTVHALFEAQVERTPDAVALVFEGETLTYAELNARANRLAHSLRARGVGPEALVGLRFERSVPMVLAVLAVLKAGGAYVPLDPSHPAERLAWVLEDSRAALVLTEVEEVEDDTNPEPLAGPGDLAYVIYTSGSTGRPKGVQVTHGAVANFLASMAQRPGLSPDDTLLAITTLAFDIAGLELLLPLTVGARVVLAPRETALDGTRLAGALKAHGVTVLQATPATWRLLLATGWGGDRGLTALCGGEALPRDLTRDLLPRVGTLWNVYGPTETTIWSSVHRVTETDVIPVGLPIANTSIHLLDRRMEPVPLGVPGELYIGGVGLARGYLRRPDLTAERFVPDPFSSGERLYRTGDLARRFPSGEIEYLGRADHQIKIRGFRVEPGEIEAALAEDPAVRQAVVVLREDAPGDQRLVAYVVWEAAGDVARLREILKSRLPAYMVPSAFVELPALPLTPSGKVDRRALPRPSAERVDEAAFVAPRTPTEAALAAIWTDVLGVERVGVHDGFFDLGGHSLLATQVAARVREIFRVELPLAVLFRETALEALARAIDALLASEGAGEAAPAIRPVPRDGEIPLSFSQQRLWFLDQLAPGNPFYNLAGGMRLAGPLDPGALCRSVGEMVRRHETLRTGFAAVAGRPVQRIVPELPVALPVLDLSALPPEEREARVREIAAGHARAPFDLRRPGLLRMTLLRLRGGERPEHLLLWAIHHIVSDAWSIGLMMGEVASLYAAFVRGEPSPLPELPVQYADFAVWQREWLSGEVLARELAWWRERLAGAPPLNLPTDRPRPPVQSFRGATVRTLVPRETSEALAALARSRGLSTFMALLGAFQVLLMRHAGQEDVVVGSPVAHRTRRETEGLIGFFVNTLVLRTDLSGDPAFEALLFRVREVCLGAYAHQDLPFEQLVEELQPRRDLSRNPLFQVALNLLNTPAPRIEVTGDLEMSPLPAPGGASLFDLQTTWVEGSEGLAITWEHATDLFDRPTVARLADGFHNLLAAAVADPARRLSDLPVLSPAERHQLLTEWNDSGEGLGSIRLDELFFERAARQPDAPAVLWRGGEVTYGELARHALGIARRLRDHGVAEGDRVAIVMEPSPERLAAVFGVLRAGAAYVALDPAHPAERLALLLEDTEAALVLTAPGFEDRVPSASARTLGIAPGGDPEAPDPGALPEPTAGPAALAYVIYTSGSTGRPKGVMISHAAAASTVLDVGRRFGVGPGDRAFAISSLSFDLSVFDVFGVLGAGGALVLPDPSPAPDPVAWAETLARHGVTLWNSAPALLDLLLSSGAPLPSTLRLVLLSGDWIPLTLPREIWRHAPDARVIGLGGPTEAAIWQNVFPVDEVRPSWVSIPYGRPLTGHTLHVLDDSGDPVPLGAVGELSVGGAGLGLGYLCRPDLTAGRFLPDPYSGLPGARLYRTGDLCRRGPDGTLEILGRRDHQLKIRGLRIELGEIEGVLASHEAVREAVAVVRPEEGTPRGEGRLVAYVVPHREAALAPEALGDLRAWLAGRLPEAMIPSAFVPLDRLPLSPNGKVDRRALPEPGLDRGGLGRPWVPPATDTERTLAGIWAGLLRLDRVGGEDDFFELGGHSLLATQVVARVRDAFGVELPLPAVFQETTLARLAARVDREAPERRPAAAAPPLPKLEPRRRGRSAGDLLARVEGLSDAEVQELLRQRKGKE